MHECMTYLIIKSRECYNKIYPNFILWDPYTEVLLLLHAKQWQEKKWDTNIIINIIKYPIDPIWLDFSPYHFYLSILSILYVSDVHLF